MRAAKPICRSSWRSGTASICLAPVARKIEHRVNMLVSRHRDGEINAVAAERLGVGTIRGSGNHGGGFVHKAGVAAFQAMLDSLAAGASIALSADVPKVARVAGLGIIKLAQASGRPIYPSAIATSRRIVLDNWDRTTINLPFGRGAGVAAEPLSVPRRCRRRGARSGAAVCSKSGSMRRRGGPMRLVDQAATPRSIERAEPWLPSIVCRWRCASISWRPPPDRRWRRRCWRGGCNRGKEHPERLAERRGEASLQRPTVRWSGCTAPASAKCSPRCR